VTDANLLIVESGAAWTSWSKAWPVQPPILALIQDTHETATQFAERVASKLDQLWARGGGLRRVLMLGADTLDVPVLSARLAILRKIRAREALDQTAVPVSLTH
jgi:hypothetical protein